jgi:carbonic anhydrase
MDSLYMAHNAKALVIACIDYRFQTQIRKFLVDRGLEDNYDLVCTAGSIKSVDDHLLKQIKISSDLHHIEEIILINHQDCGAYGLKETGDEEKEIHKTDLLKAKEIISQSFPSILSDNISLYYFKLDGTSDRI